MQHKENTLSPLAGNKPLQSFKRYKDQLLSDSCKLMDSNGIKLEDVLKKVYQDRQFKLFSPKGYWK